MIAVDTNLLLYAHRRDTPEHPRAAELIAALAEGSAAWAIPWPCVHEFLAIATHPRIFAPPTAVEEALDQVDAWLESPGLTLLGEGVGYWTALRAALVAGQVTGARVHDGRIAAICVQHGVSEFWSADRDFGRFPALRVRNPLIA